MRSLLLATALALALNQGVDAKQGVGAKQGEARGVLPCSLAIGDSITVGMAPYLRKYHIAANGRVGRQWSEGELVALAARARGALPRKVIVELGVNGPITGHDMAAMHTALRGRLVLYVTNAGPPMWVPQNNRLLLQQRYVYRWDKEANYYNTAPDGVHPRAFEYPRLARELARAIDCP